jgi:hypothetical protein
MGDGWMKELKDGMTDGCMDVRMDETDGCMGVRMDEELLDGMTDAWAYGWMKELTDGRTDG